MAEIDILKAHLFSTQMPDMPPKLREVWQVAFMYRRKYSNPVDKDPDSFFASAWNDLKFIVQTYNDNETVQALMLEVYLDIERQFKAVQERMEKS